MTNLDLRQSWRILEKIGRSNPTKPHKSDRIDKNSSCSPNGKARSAFAAMPSQNKIPSSCGQSASCCLYFPITSGDDIMSTFNLGACNLPETEIILLKTLLRLFPHDQPFQWQYVNKPPYDAVLLDASTDPDSLDQLTSKPSAILRLVGFHASDGPDVLQRPIRADRLKRWLDQVGRSITAQTRPEPDLSQNLAAPAWQAQAKNKPSLSPAQTLDPADPSPCFKLRRWPPATLLRRDPGRIRMASLLSRRALSAKELTDLSGQPRQECELFLSLITQVGLVDIQQPQVSAEPTTSTAQFQAATKRPTFARHLIVGIRKRLGIKT